MSDLFKEGAGMIFIGRERKVIIKPKVIKMIFSDINETGNEKGGILLGKVYPKHIFINNITIPGLWDKFGPFYFIRSKNKAQKEIDNAWKQSGGIEIYLGEWHSHPETNPIPSSQDTKMIKLSLRKTKMEIDFLFLLIGGLNKTLWFGEATNNSLNKLSVL
jgi:integrative and conjugative element protein (TIGR02256 family)